MNRDALVVGINFYEIEQFRLKTPAADAEAIAQLLTEYGGFRVRRLPAIKDKENLENDSGRVGQKKPIVLSQLEEALIQLFLPNGEEIPDTALLFFSGHGLRKDRGIQEGFLATSDVNPSLGNWGLSLQWLCRLLQKSPIQKQIIWLDCCYSGELLNFKEFEQTLRQTDPGTQENRDRCFITASRAFEPAREQASGQHGVLTAALLQGIDPRTRSDGWVTSHTLADFIKQELRTSTQAPICHNSGRAIIFTTSRTPKPPDSSRENICPYKGLKFFNQEDAHFFYGRTELTDRLIDRVRTENFIAVLGASGSGKSSVLRAGLLHQLKLGERLSGSDRWRIYEPFTPGKAPLQRFEQVIGKKASEIEQWFQLESERIVLVVDQFEECFTLCQDSKERQQFFDRLLDIVERLGNKFCLVLGMRADFLGKCAEYAGLASKIQKNLVIVEPMKRNDLEEAITEPARQLGVEVEPELVKRLIEDVADSPGSLPLLEYTLEELWKARKEPAINWLTLHSYHKLGGELGGVKGILNQQANQVYEKLSNTEKLVAQRIFLELTQLGDVANTRRRVQKQDLINQQHSEELLERVIQELVEARLIATDKTDESESKPAVLDIAHEALIRHWEKLGEWIKEYRVAIKIERKLEEDAKEWKDRGKPKKQSLLLQDERLVEAEIYLNNYQYLGFLDGVAEEFIQVSQKKRDRLRLRRKLSNIVASIAIFTFGSVVFSYQQQSQKNLQVAYVFGTDSTNTSESIRALSEALNRARKYKQQVDRLESTNNIQQAIEYYSTHTENIDRSFDYYRKILRVAGNLKQQINATSQAHSMTDKGRVNSILKEAEVSLAEMLKKYRIPELRSTLEQEFDDSPNKTKDTKNQSTAIQITREILMRDAGADIDGNARLTSQNEADQIPCETLKEIEQLWQTIPQKFNKGTCSWYKPNHDVFYVDPACDALNSRNLAFSVFDNNGEYAIKRIENCKK